MKPYKKKVILFAILVALLTALITSLFFFNLFIVSFFGGFSSGGSISFIALLTTFAVGGLNPWLLGITAGIALAIGDIIMFLVALKGRELIKGKWKKRIDKFSRFIEKKAHGFIPLVAYIYFGFTPFPSDLMILSLATINYPKKKAYLPIILGDLTFAILLAVLASIGISIFF